MRSRLPRSYWVHQYASLLAFLMLLVSFFVLARGLRRSGHARLAVVSRTVGLACSTGVVLLVVAPPFAVDNYGILQRAVIGALFGWPVVAGILAQDLADSLPTEDSGRASHPRAKRANRDVPSRR